LAATKQETEVEACLVALLSEGVVPEYETVKARIEPAPTPLCPEVPLLLPDLRVYDALLENPGVAL
jgi:hypothetical protein